MSNQSVLCLIWIDRWTSAPGSFLFSLRNNDDLGPFKTPLKNENTRQAIYRYNSWGPRFGDDLHIHSNGGLNTYSWAYPGRTFQPPPGYTTGEHNTNSLLAGSLHFTPSEVEVLYLN